MERQAFFLLARVLLFSACTPYHVSHLSPLTLLAENPDTFILFFRWAQQVIHSRSYADDSDYLMGLYGDLYDEAHEERYDEGYDR